MRIKISRVKYNEMIQKIDELELENAKMHKVDETNSGRIHRLEESNRKMEESNRNMRETIQNLEDRRIVKVLAVLINDAKKILDLDHFTPSRNKGDVEYRLYHHWCNDASGAVHNAVYNRHILSHFIDTRKWANVPDLRERMRYILVVLESPRVTDSVRRMMMSLVQRGKSYVVASDAPNPIDTMILFLQHSKFANVVLDDRTRGVFANDIDW